MRIVSKDTFNEYESIRIKYCSKIGILLERDLALLSTLYNCFVKRITYIPMETTWPIDRVNMIIRSAKIDTVITSKVFADKIICPNVIVVENDANVDFDFGTQTSDNDVAYIIYTSGSTGKPKGVQVTYTALLNFIDGISDVIDFTIGKRIACFTTVSFDIFFLESTMALLKGLIVVLANEQERKNPKLVAKIIKENKINMIQMTPSMMQLLLNFDSRLECLKNVGEIMLGGEVLPIKLLQTLQHQSVAKIYNMYGPTEATIWTSVSDLTYKKQIDIGVPIKDTEIYIVDEDLFVLPNGRSGEICIAGKGLAKGYWEREDLNSQSFTYLPQNPTIRIYRTGDIGRYLSNREIEFLGRKDNQIKINGYRIELEEIESYLNRIDVINQAIVTVVEQENNRKMLVAYYQSASNIKESVLIDYLSQSLPSYMIPKIYRRVESFIYNSNGKVDRKRMSECVIQNLTSEKLCNDCLIFETDRQNRAFQIITSFLDFKEMRNFSVMTDLSVIGIDSITFVQIIVALENEFDFEFDEEMLFIEKFPTIKSLVEYVELKTRKNN